MSPHLDELPGPVEEVHSRSFFLVPSYAFLWPNFTHNRLCSSCPRRVLVSRRRGRATSFCFQTLPVFAGFPPARE
jgi:hypothetical protein